MQRKKLQGRTYTYKKLQDNLIQHKGNTSQNQGMTKQDKTIQDNI